MAVDYVALLPLELDEVSAWVRASESVCGRLVEVGYGWLGLGGFE